MFYKIEKSNIRRQHVCHIARPPLSWSHLANA